LPLTRTLSRCAERLAASPSAERLCGIPARSTAFATSMTTSRSASWTQPSAQTPSYAGWRYRPSPGTPKLRAEPMDVKVEDGWVALRGAVSWQFQSDAAYEDVANLFGVIGLTNVVRVLNP
jgi:osmotically-inducible protein OsmY